MPVPSSPRASENRFDAIIGDASRRWGVPAEIIKAVVGVESSFNPRATREEPRIQDRSRGLMQILERTARGLGFRGDFEDLYDPAVNVNLGAKLLAENFGRWKRWDYALAAYNGGSPRRDAAGKLVPVLAAYVAKVNVRLAELRPAMVAAVGSGGLLVGLGIWALLSRRARRG